MTPTFLNRLSQREKRMLGLCAAAVLLFALYLGWPDDEPAGVELATSPPGAAPATLSPPVSAHPPVAAPVQAPPAAPVAAAQPAPAVSTSFVLQGVFGGGPRGGAALIATGGQTRRVPIGREVAPGVTLKSVGLDHAVLTGPDGDTRLELARSGTIAPTQSDPSQ